MSRRPPARQKLSDITRTIKSEAPSTPKRNVPVSRAAVLTIKRVLDVIYTEAELDEDLRSELVEITILNPMDEHFETYLEELVKSYKIDSDATRVLLEKAPNMASVVSLLPSQRQLEYLHIKASEEEFRAVGGSIMRFPCRKCGKFEFYFDPDRHIGGGDEASREQLSCKSCNPRYG